MEYCQLYTKYLFQTEFKYIKVKWSLFYRSIKLLIWGQSGYLVTCNCSKATYICLIFHISIESNQCLSLGHRKYALADIKFQLILILKRITLSERLSFITFLLVPNTYSLKTLVFCSSGYCKRDGSNFINLLHLFIFVTSVRQICDLICDQHLTTRTCIPLDPVF